VFWVNHRHHSGQWSKGYEELSQLSRMGYRTIPALQIGGTSAPPTKEELRLLCSPGAGAKSGWSGEDGKTGRCRP
jgi:hypothetical protein